MNRQDENQEIVEYTQQKKSFGGECLSVGESNCKQLGKWDLDDKH